MKLSFLSALSLCLLLILLLSACEEEPVEGCTDMDATNYNPSADVSDGSCLMACEVNQTAEIRFNNKSNTNSTYDIIWDGSKITTITPGDTSEYFTVTANVQHELKYQYTNTSDLACTVANPFLTQCSRETHSCTG